MERMLLGVAAIAAVLASSVPALAQSDCRQRTLRAADNPALRVQSNMGGVTDASRESARVHYWAALRDAELGNQRGCEAQYKLGAYLVSPPKPTG